MNPKTMAVVIGSLLLGFGVSYVFGGGKDQDVKDVVRARMFELINEKGEVVARIAPIPEQFQGIGIVIGDTNVPSMSLMKVDEDLLFSLGDSIREMNFGIIITKNRGTEIVMQDMSTNHKAVIGVNKNKIPFIELVDDNKWMVTPQSR